MRPVRTLVVAVVAAVLTLSACSSDGSDSNGGDAGGAAAPARAADEDQGTADSAALRGDAATGEPVEMEKAIISKGNVQLHSDDVEQAVFDVQAVVDEFAGEISDRETGTDEDGEMRNARLVLRIPAKDFQEAFAELEKVAELTSSKTTSEDVTTQVIDNAVRIRAQRRSLRRVEVLLDRAQSIRDIVAIESQLTRRQANLDSLEQQQAYLRDQTSMATVTVNIQRTSDAPPKEKDHDDAGFISGLEGGWKAMVAFGTGLATLAGALLPWTVVLALLGGPLLLAYRRLRRRTPAPAPEPTDA